MLFVLFMIINIYANTKRREQKKQTPQNFPKKYNNPKPQEQKNLDYMMAKPKINDIDKNNEITKINSKNNTVNSSIPSFNEYGQVLQNNYLTKTTTNNEISPPLKDYIQQTEIQTSNKEKNIQINIEHEHIFKAIMYAQVLEQPKSFSYLKRFGIKRIIHKD